MFLLRSVLLAALALTIATPAMAALPCGNSDPCVLNSTVTIPVGLYDIRPRSLVVGNKQITISGAGEFKILANNVTMQPGARFIATGTDGQTTVSLDAAGTMDIQSQGTSKSKIDVSGNFGGGTINLNSVGNLSINGTLIANASNLLGYGGPINIKSTNGNVSITGDPSEGIRSFGNAQGGGGAITVDAPAGSIAVSTQLVPKGGDCGGCEVDLSAGVDVTTTAQGVLDVRASGIGDGGAIDITAGRDVILNGNILANASGDEMDGGSGGDVLIDAVRNVTFGARIEINAASPDGDAGTVDTSSGGSITQTGPIIAISKGFGESDGIDYDAGANVNIAGEIDGSGDQFAADITVLADAVVTVSARVRTFTSVDPVNNPFSIGNTIDITGCQVNVTATGQLIALGPGGNPSGTNFLSASTGLTVAGVVTATDVNDLSWRTSQPVITGTITPAPFIHQVDTLACCGVACPTTTTTTSTTSTTSTSSTTSSSSTSTTSSSTSSSLIVPTTSSTSSPVPTTLPPTTSSTSLVATTSSTSTLKPTTTLATTSSTSTSIAPTTTSSSTTSISPTTTSSSTTSLLPTTTSSSTSLPTTSSTSTTTQPGATTTTSSTGVPTTSTTSTTVATTSSTSTTVATTPSTTTSTSTLGSTTSTLGSTTSTLASTTTTSSTLVTTSSTSTSTSTTVAPTTSTTSVATSSSTSTLQALPTTSTTIPTTCLDTAIGIEAVQCRLATMSDLMNQATETQLGGHKLARQLKARITKASGLVSGAQTTKRLKKASRLLKGFSNQLTHGLAKKKTPIDPTLGAMLGTLLNDARNELAGLGTS